MASQQNTNAKQEEINNGQRKINGQLCRVDWMLIEALRLLRIEMANLPDVGNKADFSKVDKMLEKAYKTSGAVAGIKPPGCEPQLVTDPNWTVIKAA